jgi:hypothetical protein
MRTTRTAALVLAAFAATATAVAIAAETDSFRGHTDGSFFSDGDYRPAKVSFLLTGNRLRHVRYEIRVRCPSGQRRSVVEKIGTIPVQRDGSFLFEEASASPEGFHEAPVFRGRIQGDHAEGVARLTVTLDSHGRRAPSNRNCVSRTVEWEARSG